MSASTIITSDTQDVPSIHRRKPRLACVVTVSMSVKFFEGQLQYLAERGFDVTIVSSPGHELDRVAEDGIVTRAIPMEREISPFRDLRSFWALWRLFRKLRPDIVNAGTPKAGLLGTLAARMAGVPCVIYTLRGLRLETTSGWKRCVLILTEGIACRLAHKVRCVSYSLRRNALKVGIVEEAKAYVVGNGTSNGINVQHHTPSGLRSVAAADLRSKLGIPARSLVLGFVGRFTRDKGVEETYRAFVSLKAVFPDLKMLMVGDFESGDPVPASLRSSIESDSDIIRTGFVAEVAPYYSVVDVLIFPTYREGFPGVPLEAQATGVPAVVSDATGAVESVIDGVTGIVVPVGDVDRLQVAVRRLLDDPGLRKQMGDAGAGWVAQNFGRDVVWNALLVDYQGLVREFVVNKQRGWKRTVKTAFDRLAACILLILSFPVCVLAGFVILLKLGRPVLFRQIRPGLRGKPFELIKFRTMSNSTAASGEPLSDDLRLTAVGRLLRTLSIDEIPQLWNVLKGNMSMVGPRPLLTRYLERYTPEQARRHDVLPGITGWAQVNGRNSIGWKEKLEYDVYYVDNWSLWLDLKILLLTLWKVVGRQGIANSNHATMPEFMGTDQNDSGIEFAPASATLHEDWK